MTYKPALMLVPFAMMVSVPMRADLTFNISYDPSMSAFGAQLANLKAATQDVANEYSHLFTNNVTVNILVKADTDPNGLGSSLFEDNGMNYSYDQVRTALINNASTPASTSATSSLPTVDPTGGGNFIVPNAEAKALGLIPGNGTALDGTFFIGTANSYAFDPNNRAVPGAFDYLGTAEHEFSEIMGRSSQLTNTGFGFLPFDLFRFTGNGVRNLNPNATGVYFSTDNGATVADAYNPPGNGGDIQDWASDVPPDSYAAFGMTNESEPILPVDVTTMNTLGWQTLAVPEPSSLALTLICLFILGLSGARLHSKQKPA